MTEERVVAYDLASDDEEVLVFGKLIGRTPDMWVEVGPASSGLQFREEYEPEDDWTPEVLTRTASLAVTGSTRDSVERYRQILFATRATIQEEVLRTRHRIRSHLWEEPHIDGLSPSHYILDEVTHQEAAMPTTSPSPSSPYYPPPFSGGTFAEHGPDAADLERSTWEEIRGRLTLAATREPVPLREEPGCDSMKWKPAEDETEPDDDVRLYTMGSPA